MCLPSQSTLALRLLWSCVSLLGTRCSRSHDVCCAVSTNLARTRDAVESCDVRDLILSCRSYDFNPNVCARLGSRSELQPADVLLWPGDPTKVSATIHISSADSCCCLILSTPPLHTRHTSHITRHTSHVTRHTSGHRARGHVCQVDRPESRDLR